MPEPRCPACLGPLDIGADAWRCRSCDAPYRGLRGIPDLRVADDGYLIDADDWAFALRLDAASDRLDFLGLLDLYFGLSPDVDPSRRAVQVAHILNAPARVAGWVDALGPDLPGGPWLDLGCGSGSFLAAEGRGRDVVGLDVAIRWLLVARKRLDEAGLGHVRLVRGNAERLPFPDRTFAAVVAGDVAEHVADQPAMLAEAHRVLVPGGRLFLATPNRFSLAPEPHVGVWGVGFLPRSRMPGYVRWMSGRDFRAIRTLSFVGWTRLLRESPFEGGSVRCPPLPDSELDGMARLKRRLATAYNGLATSRAGRWPLRAVGPLFHVVATRRERPPTSRPPRPSTRR